MTNRELKVELPFWTLPALSQEMRMLSMRQVFVEIKLDFVGLSPHVIDLLTATVIESFPYLDIVSVGREGTVERLKLTATIGWNDTIYIDMKIEEILRKTEDVIKEYKDSHDMPDLISSDED